ncbi:MAG: SDR family oxidoreductase [Syntrophomonadaceae bacterium]|jgi:3-oxoacyl-[acyl-carrier protein] reductase|nr:SDR family oxidoreductase [Syntrophomonadaceae bacterium]
MDLGLKGKGALVMASSAGLGKAMALELAREGANVMLFSPFEEELKTAQADIKAAAGIEPAYTVGDITVYDDIKKAVQNTAAKFGSVDILINNTGGPPAGPFDGFDDNVWQKAFELTLLSYVRAIREVLPYMRQNQWGRILNSTSSSIKAVLDNLVLSNTLRAGVVGLSKTLSQELGKDGILVNVIAPGRIGTARTISLDQMRADKQGIALEDQIAQTAKIIPLGRYGSPEEYGKLAAFLCSGANTYITGQAILVDGGMVKAL